VDGCSLCRPPFRGERGASLEEGATKSTGDSCPDERLQRTAFAGSEKRPALLGSFKAKRDGLPGTNPIIEKAVSIVLREILVNTGFSQMRWTMQLTMMVQNAISDQDKFDAHAGRFIPR
jgi:hypothetical protein